MSRTTTVLAALCLTSILSACSPSEDVMAVIEPPTLTEQWVLEGFDGPESVIEARDGEALYVSNAGGDGSAKDGNGVISIIGKNGTMIDRNWSVGTEAMPLHGPKGMALIGDNLFVTDIDHVVIIDVWFG